MALCPAAITIRAQSETKVDSHSTPTGTVGAGYFVAERGPHHRLWKKLVESKSPTGEPLFQTNSYVEIAAGLHAWDGQKYVEASQQIEVTQSGAATLKGAHKAQFAGNILGAVEVATPDGKRLRSRILGISFCDWTGKNVLFAELQDSIGELLPSRTEIIYPNAFRGTSASVRYRNRLAGLEQDVILNEQLPTPAEWGLDVDSAKVQIWTEFFELSVPPKAHRRGNDGDSLLDFGAMQIGEGQAFAIEGGSRLPVHKSWQTIQGRNFLVEEVDYKAILPATKTLSARAQNKDPGSRKQGALRQKDRGEFPPPPIQARTKPAPMILAESSGPKTGFIIDYNLVQSITNVVFGSGGTFLIDSEAYLSGTVVFEGDAVLKYAEGSALHLENCDRVEWKAGPYHQIICTSKDDNSVGALISGSTGNPARMPQTTFFHLSTDNPENMTDSGSFHDLRLSYAATGLLNTGTNQIINCQFVDCGTAIAGADGASIQNVLYSQCDVCYSIVAGTGGKSLDLAHVTADRSQHLIRLSVDEVSTTAVFSYCLLTEVANLSAIDGVGSTLSLELNGSPNLPSRSGVYQAAGAGAYYLPAGSPYRLTTLNPPESVVSRKTTYAPVVYSNTSLTANLTLYRQTHSESPSMMAYGYFYDPVDFLIGDMVVTNSTLTLSPGVVVATFAPPDNRLGAECGAGIILHGGNLVSWGSLAQRNYLIRYNSVQEGSLYSSEAPTTCYIVANYFTLSNTPYSDYAMRAYLAPSATETAVSRIPDISGNGWDLAGQAINTPDGWRVANRTTKLVTRTGNLLTSTNQTFGFRIRLDDLDFINALTTVLGYRIGTSSSYSPLVMQPGVSESYCEGESFSGTASGWFGAPLGPWRNLVIVHSANTGRAYLDGTLIQTYTYKPYTAAGTLEVGNSLFTASMVSFREIAVWNRALSPAEVLAWSAENSGYGQVEQGKFPPLVNSFTSLPVTNLQQSQAYQLLVNASDTNPGGFIPRMAIWGGARLSFTNLSPVTQNPMPIPTVTASYTGWSYPWVTVWNNYGLATRRSYPVYLLPSQSPPVTNATASTSQLVTLETASPVGKEFYPRVVETFPACGLNIRFTEMTAPGGSIYLMCHSGQVNYELRDCVFRGGSIYVATAQAGPGINGIASCCLFHRVSTSLVSWNAGLTEDYHNNLFYGGIFTFTRQSGSPTLTIQDNLFDQTAISGFETAIGAYSYDHNGYVGGGDRLQPTSDSDVVLNSMSYDVGPQGEFYTPAASLLLDAGSRSGFAAGLAAYTSNTNQLQEGLSPVDIGLHYLIFSGNALDQDGDGLTDTQEAAIATDPYNPDTDGDGGSDFTESVQGRNALVTGVISDTNGVLSLQVYTPLR